MVNYTFWELKPNVTCSFSLEEPCDDVAVATANKSLAMCCWRRLPAASGAHPFLLPPVRGEVVHRDLHALPLLQLAQRRHQEVKVERVWMVEVVVIAGGQGLLLLGENL